MNINRVKDLYEQVESLMRNYEDNLVSFEEIGYVMAYETGNDILDVLEEIIDSEEN